MKIKVRLHPKIKSWINSCTTYDQVQTCMNFINFYKDESIKFEILSLIQNKAYAMRNADLKEHNEFLNNLVNG